MPLEVIELNAKCLLVFPDTGVSAKRAAAS